MTNWELSALNDRHLSRQSLPTSFPPNTLFVHLSRHPLVRSGARLQSAVCLWYIICITGTTQDSVLGLWDTPPPRCSWFRLRGVTSQ